MCTDIQVKAVETYFLPAERASSEELDAARSEFQSNKLASSLLEAIPDLAVVLNPQRQIVASNDLAFSALGFKDPGEIIGMRPGEAFGCVHAFEQPGGCGTSWSCTVCGAVSAIAQSLRTRKTCTNECRIRTTHRQDGGAIDVQAHTTYLTIGERNYVVLAMHDISSEKRRSVLERTFFHDVLNVASGLSLLTELLVNEQKPEIENEYKHDLQGLVSQICDEITSHRQLLAAESGALAAEVTFSDESIPPLVESVIEMCRNQPAAKDRHIQTGEVANELIRTDPTLCRRVLGNLVKNALEATPSGGTVELSAEDTGDNFLFKVSNPGVIPQNIQKQIFQRSFSTKGGSGRGIGTHSVKLLTEQYLGGKASFVSDAAQGTVFMVSLPK